MIYYRRYKYSQEVYTSVKSMMFYAKIIQAKSIHGSAFSNASTLTKAPAIGDIGDSLLVAVYAAFWHCHCGNTDDDNKNKNKQTPEQEKFKHKQNKQET